MALAIFPGLSLTMRPRPVENVASMLKRIEILEISLQMYINMGTAKNIILLFMVAKAA